MKTLSDFDCMCLRPSGALPESATRIKNDFPQAVFVAATKVDEKIAAVEKMTGAYVLILPAFIMPHKYFALVKPDAELLDAGYRLGWMTRNVITGEIAANRAPELWRRADYLAQLIDTKQHDQPPVAVLPARAVMPEIQADWAFNTSSGAAFAAGFDHVVALQSNPTEHEPQKRLTIAATIGKDADFADWWHLGVLSAITGQTDRVQAYQSEKNRTSDRGEMQRRLDDLARDIRLNHGPDVRILSAKNSRFFKNNKFLMPPRDAYETLAGIFRQTDSSNAARAQQYIQAANWVWGAR